MKKLLALVLSIAMVLTMFSGTLGVFAAEGNGSVTTLSGYEGIMPDSAAGVFGFEDASRFTFANSELDTDATSGKSSLKIKGNGKTVANVAGLIPADFQLTAGAQYRLTVRFKTTADFDGNINIGYYKDGKKTQVFAWATEDHAFKAAEHGVKERNWAYYTSDYNHGSATRADILNDWFKSETAKLEIEVSGHTAGTAWLDDISYINTTDLYSGAFAAITGGEGKEDGGYETKVGYYSEVAINDRDSKINMHLTHFKTFKGEDPIDMSVQQDGKAGNMRLVERTNANNDNVFQGKFSAEIYKVADTQSGVTFYAAQNTISADKNYYLQAWVKLDNFNGAVLGGVGTSNQSAFTSGILYTYNGEFSMLGNTKRYVTKEDVGGEWMLISTPVIPGATIKEKFTGDNIAFSVAFKGLGRIYLDNVDLVEAGDNTPLFSSSKDSISAKTYYGDDNYSKVYLTTAGDNSDIWYTTDGTNPLTSATAKLYDPEYAIRTGTNMYIKAVGIDKATYAVSDVVTYSNIVNSNYYKIMYRGEAFYYNDIVLENGADLARLTDINDNDVTIDTMYSFDISDYGPMKQDVNYTFTVTADDDFTGEAWVKIFLKGGSGYDDLSDNEGEQNGCFIGRDGYVAKITEPGTQTVTVKLTALEPHHAFTPVIERKSGSGKVTLVSGDVEVEQVGMPFVSVNELYYNKEIGEDGDFEEIYLDYHIEGTTKPIIPIFTNNSAYQLNGTLKYVLEQVDGTNKYSYDIATVSIDAGSEFADASFLLDDVVDAYGVYNAKYILDCSDSGMEYVLSDKVIAYLADNSDAEIFAGVNVGLFSMDYDTAVKTIDLLKKLGVKTARSEIREGIAATGVYEQVENGEGETENGALLSYEIDEKVLSIINYAKEAGVEINILVNGYKNIDQFKMLATAIKETVGDAAEQYEIINEPNASMSGATYAGIVKAVQPILKTENNKIMAGNVSHHGGGFLEEMIAAETDILEYIDVWSVHPYVFNWYEGINADYSTKTGTWEESGFQAYIDNIKATYLEKPGIELWAGEIGFPTANGRCIDKRVNIPCVAVEDSAEHTVRSYLGAEVSGYDRMIQYAFSGDSAYSAEQSYGIVNTTKRTPIAAISAYTALTKGYTLDGQTVNGDVYVQKYTKENGDVTYAIWTTGEDTEVTVTVPSSDYGVADMYGNKEACGSMASTGDAVTATVTATTEPVYVVPFVDEYIEPLAEGIIKNGSMEGETKPAYDYESGTFGYDYDKFIKYDGEQSLKMTFTGGAAGQVGVHFNLDMSKADLNKLYTIRFKYKTVDFDGKISITSAIANGLTYKRHNDQGEMFADVNLTATTDGWETYESQAIALSGTGGFFRYQFITSTNSDATVWLDAVELVPVEGTGSEYGTITNPVWDADNNRMLVTVTPVEGYHVESVLAKGNNGWYGGAPGGWEQPKELVSEIVSTDSETGAVTFAYKYLVAAEPTRKANIYFTPYGIYQHLTATFAKGYLVNENNIIADGNCEDAFNIQDHCQNASVSIDKEVFYDGAGSYKMVNNNPHPGNGVNFKRVIDISNLDLNTTYKLRFKYKTEDAQLNFAVRMPTVYNGGAVRPIIIADKMYSDMLASNINIQTENTTTDGWATYETNAFCIVGETLTAEFLIRNLTTAETSTIWLDRFEIVPVDTTDRHGKVTTSYDAENSRILVTATPEEGFEVNFMPQAQNHDKNDKLFNMKHELVSVDEATGAETYAVEFVSEDGTTPLNRYFAYAHKPYVMFKTSFAVPSIVTNGNMEDGLPSSWDGAFSSKASIDTTVKYDGLQSMKLSLAAGGSTNIVNSIPASVMESLDVSVQYKAVIRLKSSIDSTYSLQVDRRAYANNTDGKRYEYAFGYNWLHGGEIMFGQNIAIGTEWTTLESPSFSLLGDDVVLLWPISNKGSEAVTLWVDAIQIVPVEENTSNGVVTQTIDDNGNVIFTAKANEGYMLDTFAVYGTKAYADAAVEIDSAYVAQTAVDVVSYSANLAGYATWSGKGYDVVKATFVEITDANGDATGDGKVDVRDLVRFKNFELGNTAEIEYANVWYDREKKDLGATDFTELRKQIWNMF